MKHLISLVLFFVLSGVSVGELRAQPAHYFMTRDPAWPVVSSMREFHIKTDDQVSDGCWTTAQDSLNRVTLEVIRSGGTIKDEKFFGPQIIVSAFGYGIRPSSCAVLVHLSVSALGHRSVKANDVRVDSIFSRPLWYSSNLLTGPRSDMSSRVADAHERLVREFLVSLETSAQSFEEQAQEVMLPEDYSAWRTFLDR